MFRRSVRITFGRTTTGKPSAAAEHPVQLAFAIAHELAHINLRHHVARLRSQRLVETGGTEHEALLRAIKNQLDREAEMEADRFGALYAVRAGFRYTASSE